MNVQQLIALSLKTAGVVGNGQTAAVEDTNDVFTMLNSMVAVWCRKRWLTYHLVDTSCQSTGAQSYTVGLGQSFNVTVPDKIHAAYARLQPAVNNNPVDVPLAVVPSYEDYSQITLKSMVSFPSFVFLDSNYPIGKVFVYPIPNNNYEIHIVTKETLNQFTNLTSTITFPPEYLDALIWNLAMRIRTMYQMPVDQMIIGYAMTSLNTIRNSNAQIPTMNMPYGSHRGNVWTSHGIANGVG